MKPASLCSAYKYPILSLDTVSIAREFKNVNWFLVKSWELIRNLLRTERRKVMHQLHEEWTANVVGRMHRYGIKGDELARRCQYSPQYLSMVLNGKKEFGSKAAKQKVRRKIFESLHFLEKEIENERVSD